MRTLERRQHASPRRLKHSLPYEYWRKRKQTKERKAATETHVLLTTPTGKQTSNKLINSPTKKSESDVIHFYSREDRYFPYFHPRHPKLNHRRTTTTLEDWRRSTSQLLEHAAHILVLGWRFLGRRNARRPRLSCTAP